MWWLIVLAAIVAVYYLFPRPAKNIRGQTALITGGGSGIGRLLALKLAKEENCKIVIWDVNEKGIADVVKEIETVGVEARGYKVDVTNREEVYALAARVKKEIGPVHILVNNAGIVSGELFWNLKDEAIQRVINVNVLGVFWVTKAFISDMMKDNVGHIVNVASAGGTVGVPKLADYCASKFAVFGFNEALRLELAGAGSKVQTTVVCPHYINTGMFTGVQSPFPLLPILEPSYVVEAIKHAIKTNQQELYIPRTVSIGYAARFLFPTTLRDVILSLMGLTKSMSDFKGERRV
eukprot:TRINITY_DN22378_c0_g1_i1.p1 TRINITY_DN22378_c0_g1~~TRINITY_DN22378_c0_g1_i1.p1  ORF type:complete len:293 (+),score=92.17 TRINITY_DN22378_c0_g1_i1:47-925(+)